MFNNFAWNLFPRIQQFPMEEPPTVYSLLESIVNYGKDKKTKIKDLASVARETIFDFNYPLSDKIDKSDFETLLLNKFIMRRIGFETFTAFQIALNVKLNEIMPSYNKLFDSLEGWELFNDGETVIREQEDSRNTDTTNKNNISNTLENSSTTGTDSTSDRRKNDLPQSQIENVKDGSYLSEYNYDTDHSSGNDSSNSTGVSETEGKTNVKDNGNLLETIKRSPSDKIKIYLDFIQNKQNIYTLIFQDLNSLFYQIVTF